MHSLPSLVETLQRFRRARRISQLELALRLGVSQRHVSFVENGRSRPSRDLLVAWLQALDAPLALSNEALLAAGYAPAYSRKRLDDPCLAEAGRALDRLLETHDPAPALVLGAEWNVVRMNRGAVWLATLLMPSAAAGLGHAPVNMLDLLTHPGGLADQVTNLGEVGPRFLWMLRNDAAVHPGLQPRAAACEAYLSSRIGEKTLPGPGAPVLTTRFASPHGPLAFFSMFSTFGTPNDITLASLRVEHMFPADDATRVVLDRHVIGHGADRSA
ncbi:MAG: helix-turn-helix transcriptional regulator [Lysobacteraceae bacterium]